MDVYKDLDGAEYNHKKEDNENEDSIKDIYNFLREIMELYSKRSVLNCINKLRILNNNIQENLIEDGSILIDSEFINFLLSEIFVSKNFDLVLNFSNMIALLYRTFKEVQNVVNNKDIIIRFIENANDESSHFHKFFFPLLCVIYLDSDDKEIQENIKIAIDIDLFLRSCEESKDHEQIYYYLRFAGEMSKDFDSAEEINKLIDLCSFFSHKDDIENSEIKCIADILFHIIPKENFDIYYFLDQNLHTWIKYQIEIDDIVSSDFYYVQQKLLKYIDYISFDYMRPILDAINKKGPICVSASFFISCYSRFEFVSAVLWKEGLVKFIFDYLDTLNINAKLHASTTVLHALKFAKIDDIVNYTKLPSFFEPVKIALEIATEEGFYDILDALDNIFSQVTLSGDQDLLNLLIEELSKFTDEDFFSLMKGYTEDLDIRVDQFIHTYISSEEEDED